MSTAGRLKTKVVSIPQNNGVDISELSDEELFFEQERISRVKVEINEIDLMIIFVRVLFNYEF